MSVISDTLLVFFYLKRSLLQSFPTQFVSIRPKVLFLRVLGILYGTLSLSLSVDLTEIRRQRLTYGTQ